MWNQDSVARETARQLFTAIAKISEDLARLQEQQKIDTAIAERFRMEIEGIKAELYKLLSLHESSAYQIKDLQHRVEYLEASLSGDLKNLFLTNDDFDQYLFNLKKDKLESDRQHFEKIQKTRRQLGIVAGGLIVAIAPKLWELLLFVLDLILDHL